MSARVVTGEGMLLELKREKALPCRESLFAKAGVLSWCTVPIAANAALDYRAPESLRNSLPERTMQSSTAMPAK